MKKTTYVFHCEICNQLVLKEKRDQKDCPVIKNTPVELPMISWASFSGHEYGEWKDGRKPYFDENLDCMVYSKAHKEEILKEKGLRQVDSGARKSKPKPLYFT